MELSTLQTKILNAPYNKIVVNSAAASGKTALLTEKVRQILRANTNPREVVVITFTNMAAGELKHRLGADYKEGLFIGTIHSLANQMLVRNGISTTEILEKEKFDKLFSLIKKNQQCIWPIEWLLLDEAQDSDDKQFEFMFDMIKPRCFFVVGDLRQCIYRWNGSNPRLLRNLSRQPDVHTFSMNENHRNGNNILVFAKGYLRRIRQSDDSIALRPGGQIQQIPYSPRAIVKNIALNPNYKDWAILTRTNDQISNIIPYLENAHIPYATFKQGDLDREQLQNIMDSNTVKLLTIHSAKGLEWSNVIMVGVLERNRNDEEFNVAYVAATRARDNLIVMSIPEKEKKNEFSFE
jgi:DNA helicase-2/ATP-dependent DNA helicase PcrA